jgi:pyruvate/2-oxoglutarate/acetoin dehydrogenase E1 component
MTVRDALTSALDEEMARDKDVFILGEEVRESERERARSMGGGGSTAAQTETPPKR